jgi:hypothetical protein
MSLRCADLLGCRSPSSLRRWGLASILYGTGSRDDAVLKAQRLLCLGSQRDTRVYFAKTSGRPRDARAVLEPARPYLNSPQTIEEIIQAGRGVPDPGGVAGALRYDVVGSFRGAQGTWELVVTDANEILHFNFVR